MKKFLIGIFSIVLGFVGFSSALDITEPGQIYVGSFGREGDLIADCFSPITITYTGDMTKMYFFAYVFSANGNQIKDSRSEINPRTNYSFSPWCSDYQGYYVFGLVNLDDVGQLFTLGAGGGTPEDITVYYNNGNSTETITCDGTQAIEIQGLSTITSSNTFTPYFNVSYKDEDNQSLVESYSKDILYLENSLFKKTYTGDNNWILTSQGNGDDINNFTGYLPTFEITGGIEDVSESGNIFNNFAENSVKFTLSNIPSYIQYVILLFILFFILGFIRKFRRK